MSAPGFICGGSIFGASWPQSQEDMDALLEALKAANITRIDTAALYPIINPGASEKLLGAAAARGDFQIDTKVMYNTTGGDGTMAPAAVEASVTQSLSKLQIPKINVLSPQGPDRSTPLADQAAALQAAVTAGHATSTGICNLSPDTLSEYLALSASAGHAPPAIYQGQYNVLCRSYETTLFPLLRRSRIPFAAASTLAGGFLLGKLTFAEAPDSVPDSRFEHGNVNGMFLRFWYDKPSMHQAVRRMRVLCQEYGTEMADAAVRWVLFHSALRAEEGDMVVIGPKSLGQLEGYVRARERGPLPKGLVEGLDGLWEGVREDAAAIVQV